jgi:hypothetical protein
MMLNNQKRMKKTFGKKFIPSYTPFPMRQCVKSTSGGAAQNERELNGQATPRSESLL